MFGFARAVGFLGAGVEKVFVVDSDVMTKLAKSTTGRGGEGRLLKDLY